MTPEVIAEVRMRASILEVISETVVLKRAGKEYRGLCPFHDEKSPSFNVNPDKGIFKCFGCNEGGDVFAFVQRKKGINFIETVRELARKYGVQLVETESERKEYDRRSQILMLYQQASEYYIRLLKDPQEGIIPRKYLADRGLSEETIDKFKLGYAPDAWDGLLNYLSLSAGASAATLEEAGLVKKRAESSGHYDLYRNRLMIPICDRDGRVIAFGGRTLGDDQVKYINSPETPIYSKGQNLFGFNLAKDSIKERDSVIVVEGYFDAITPHQYGFTNVVATLGTALTEQQAKLLVRYTDSKRVYLSFDADAAGARAIESGGETLNQIAEGVGIDLKVLKIPGGKDPDECLRAGPEGVAAFAQAIEKAATMIDFRLERAVSTIDFSSRMGRIDASKAVVPILASIKNAVARGEYVRQWSPRLGLREEEILSDVGEYRRKNRLDQPQGYGHGVNQGGFNQGFNQGQGQGGFNGGQGGFKKPPFKKGDWKKNKDKKDIADEEGLPMPPGARGHGIARSAPVQGSLDAERSLLALYLTSREDYDVVFKRLTDETLLNAPHQEIKEALEGIGSNFNTMEDLQSKLMDRVAPVPITARALVDIIYKAEDFRKQKPPVQVVLKESRARILKERLDLLSAAVRREMTSADENGSDQSALQSRMMELTRLEHELPKLDSLEQIEEFKQKIDTFAPDSNGFSRS
ncbi:MAG: DNA primase [Candidatus Obscuribacterales bacterium]